MPTDPICGMHVDEGTELTAERDGQTLYFCSDHCRQKFVATGEVEVPHSCCHEHTRSSHREQQGLSIHLPDVRRRRER